MLVVVADVSTVVKLGNIIGLIFVPYILNVDRSLKRAISYLDIFYEENPAQKKVYVFKFINCFANTCQLISTTKPANTPGQNLIKVEEHGKFCDFAKSIKPKHACKFIANR